MSSDATLDRTGLTALELARAQIAPLIEPVRRLNQKAQRLGVKGERDSKADAASKELTGEWTKLRAEFNAAGLSRDPELFEQALQTPVDESGLGMNADEARALVADGREIDEVGAKALATGLEAQQHDGDALLKLCETAKWRRMVMGRALSRRDEDEAPAPAASDDHFAEFAPLLRWIAAEASPAIKAELAAKMVLYVRSGHAHRDCLAPVDPEAPLTPAAEAIRALHERIVGGDGAVPPGAFTDIDRRFEEVFERYKVEQRLDAHGEPDWIARPLTASEARSGANAPTPRRAPSGEIDAVIRDARDPSICHLAVASADTSLVIERNQCSRHVRAFANGVAEGEIQGVSEIRPTLFAPSLLYAEAAPDGKELRSRFLGSLTEPLTKTERQSLNAMPFLSTIARVARNSNALDVSDLCNFELRLFGGNCDDWNEKMQAVRRLPDATRRESFLTVVGDTLAVSLDGLSKRNINAPKFMTSGANHPMLGSFCEALEGLTRHAVDCPSALRAFDERRQDELSLLRLQLTANSEMKGRLEDLSAKFEDGFEDWAARTLRREERDRERHQRAMAAAAPAKQSDAVAATAIDRGDASAPAPSQTPSQSDDDDEKIRRFREAKRQQIEYRDGRFAAIKARVASIVRDDDRPSADTIRKIRKSLEADREEMGEPLSQGDRAALDIWLDEGGGGVQRIMIQHREQELVEASQRGDEARAKALLALDVDPFASHEGITARGAAEEGGHTRIVDAIDEAVFRHVLQEAAANEAIRAAEERAAQAAQAAPSQARVETGAREGRGPLVGLPGRAATSPRPAGAPQGTPRAGAASRG